jgi:hypothetical protein
MRRLALLAVTLGLAVQALVFPATPALAESWLAYVNPRFGSVIEYPERFRALRPPDNGDGQAFEAADGARLTISGSHNINDDTPASYEKFLRESDDGAYADVVYRTSGTDWLVLSGRRNGEIYYERILFDQAGETIHHLSIVYPAVLRNAYDPIVQRLSRSLRSAR